MRSTQDGTGVSRAKWRCRTYSLRALFLLLTAAAIGCGWAYWKIRGFYQQRADIDAFIARGARIETEPALPAWLSRFLGDEEGKLFVTPVSFYANRLGESSGKLLDDRDFEVLASWKQLRSLFVMRAAITDMGLSHLALHPRLERLALNDTPLSDEGLRHVGHAPHLVRLSLGCESLSDDGLKHLAPLQHLNALDISRGRITGVGLRHLAGRLRNGGLRVYRNCTDEGLEEIAKAFPHLSTLEVGGTTFTDVGLSRLSGLSRLHTLIVEFGSAIDHSVKCLRQLPALRDLHIQHTLISDNALLEIAESRSLRSLTIEGDCASRPGLKALVARNPNLLVRSHDFYYVPTSSDK